MSKIGVPSIRSAPETRSTGPSGVESSTDSSFTQERPRGFGRTGARVAKTPMRVFPPRRGGRTSGDQGLPKFSENPQMSQRWEKPSIPRRASASR